MALQAYIAKLPEKRTVTVYLNSPGGSIEEGIALGRLFHRAKIRTAVIGKGVVCNSACTTAFLGGRDPETAEPWRAKGSTAMLGFQSFKIDWTDKSYTAPDMSMAIARTQRMTLVMADYMAEVGRQPRVPARESQSPCRQHELHVQRGGALARRLHRQRQDRRADRASVPQGGRPELAIAVKAPARAPALDGMSLPACAMFCAGVGRNRRSRIAPIRVTGVSAQYGLRLLRPTHHFAMPLSPLPGAALIMVPPRSPEGCSMEAISIVRAGCSRAAPRKRGSGAPRRSQGENPVPSELNQRRLGQKFCSGGGGSRPQFKYGRGRHCPRSLGPSTPRASWRRERLAHFIHEAVRG